jgi:hypothetical protein
LGEKHTSGNISKGKRSWAPVIHTCNPSNSGGRDQEDHTLKPAWANSLQDPISKNTYHKKKKKKAGGVAQGIGSQFKFQYCKKKKRKNILRKLELMPSDCQVGKKEKEGNICKCDTFHRQQLQIF